MEPTTSAVDLAVVSDGVHLSGSAWVPMEPVRAVVLMIPGSGPSDRHNDGYFGTIRGALLAGGIAVASFDKRGVARSEGDWQAVGFDTRVSDVISQGQAVASVDGIPADRIGLFGHSQGGWIALEAATAVDRHAFAITNSGPAVGPGEQTRYALVTAMHRADARPGAAAALALYDETIGSLRAGVAPDELAKRRHDRSVSDQLRVLRASGFDWPTAEGWRHLGLIIDHDPVPAIRRIRCPLLAIFGSDDRLVPVQRSVDILGREARDDLLTTTVFPGADHRIQEDGTQRLAEGYLDQLVDWINKIVGGPSQDDR